MIVLNILADRFYAFVAVIIGFLIVLILYKNSVYIILLNIAQNLFIILDLLRIKIFSCLERWLKKELSPTQKLEEYIVLIKRENEAMELIVENYAEKKKKKIPPILMDNFIEELKKKKENEIKIRNSEERYKKGNGSISSADKTEELKNLNK